MVMTIKGRQFFHKIGVTPLGAAPGEGPTLFLNRALLTLNPALVAQYATY